MALKFSCLSRPAVRTLKAGQKLTEHGICAERLGSGDLRFSINIMVDGRRIHRVVGRESEGVTREQAERLIEKLRTDAREGRLNLPKGRKTALSFKEGALSYLTRLEESGGKHIARKRQHIERQLIPHFGSARLNAVTEFAIKAYRKRRRDAGLKEATINRELATLSHLLRSAAKWGWIKKDEVPEIQRVKETSGRIIALTDHQYDALMRAAIADQDTDLWLFVMAGLNTGMRHSEITHQKLELMDLDRLRIFIEQAKAGAREQPITPAYAEALRRVIDQRGEAKGWLFPSRVAGTKEGRRSYFTQQFRRAVVRAELDPKLITPHVMRHTAITRLVKAGVDIPTIMKVSGHKTVSMVLRYTHVDSPHIDAAAANLSTPLPLPIEPHRMSTAAA